MGDGHALARQLLDRADDDIAAAAALLEVEQVSDAIVGFHAQQAVEKALKAVLAAAQVDYPFTHDLQLLVALCGRAVVPMPADLADTVPRLSPYAARLRYGAVDADIVDRATALRWAREAVAWARSRTVADHD